MSVTWDGDYNRARPLSALVDRKNDAIYFLLTDDGATWWEDAGGSEIRLYNGHPSDGEPWDSPGNAKVTSECYSMTGLDPR